MMMDANDMAQSKKEKEISSTFFPFSVCVRALCAMCIIIRRKNHKKMDCILYKRKRKERKTFLSIS
jgi:hypothetical protein